MGNILTKRRRFYGRLEEDNRTPAVSQQQQLLRNMAAHKHIWEVDWPTVIQKADELHRQEQQKLGRKEKQWRRRQLRRSKYIRKKYGEPTGLYCVNLLAINNKGDRECFLEDEFDDSYSTYYTTAQSATMEYITDATESSTTIDCGTAEAASTMEFATQESSTLEYTTGDSSTIEEPATISSFSERFHKIAACQPKNNFPIENEPLIEVQKEKQEESHKKTTTTTTTALGRRQKDAIDSSFSELAMHAPPHGLLSTLTEELSTTSESDSAMIPPTAVWI